MKNKDEKLTFDEERELITRLTGYWDMMVSKYAREFTKIKVLDATDRGEFWTALGIKFPPYQILPDTNFVSYVKSNLLASLYSVAKSAELMPTAEADKELVQQLNVALDAYWDTAKVGLFQFQAGERAALCNLGLTQVGWSEDFIQGAGERVQKGQVRLKNINPLQWMRDPSAAEYTDAQYCCTFDYFHANDFKAHPHYKENFETFIQQNGGDIMSTPQTSPEAIRNGGRKDYYTLITYWLKTSEGVDEIHVVNNKKILWYRKNIKPAQFPFALCYCNLPVGALIGTSEPSKIFANNVAYNLLDSLILTAEYKNQRPPKFVSNQAKLNIQAFAKHGDDASKTFVVAGPARDAVHYQQYPAPSNIVPVEKQSLQYGIEQISGVDGRYTGRDTGSIITTGGTEDMLNRVTMIDTPKITLYEDYCRQLTELILRNMLAYSPTRKFFRKDPKTREYKTTEVNFPDIDEDTLFNYRITISSELPKNKQRVSAMATALLQAQAQYRKSGDSVNWITEEEWLMFQDLPFKEYMLERMGIQRQENALEETAQVLYQFADLVKQGLTPDQAMQATAQTLLQSRRGVTPEMPVGANPQLEAMGVENGTL